jgi:signal transduction histidine kinase
MVGRYSCPGYLIGENALDKNYDHPTQSQHLCPDREALNGRGFDPATVKRGNGLLNMQRRAEKIGGRFVVESAVGQGTRVEVRV